MRRVTDPATQREMLADVESEADRLYRLVEDLLILSRARRACGSRASPSCSST